MKLEKWRGLSSKTILTLTPDELRWLATRLSHKAIHGEATINQVSIRLENGKLFQIKLKE